MKPTAPYPAILGTVIATFRQRRGVSLQDAANVMIIAPSTLSRIEEGKYPVTVEQLTWLAHLLDVRPSDMLCTADNVACAMRLAGYDVSRSRSHVTPIPWAEIETFVEKAHEAGDRHEQHL